MITPSATQLIEVDPQARPFLVSGARRINLGDHAQARGGDIEAHAEQAKVVQRIVATPAGPDSPLQLFDCHTGTVVPDCHSGIGPILRG